MTSALQRRNRAVKRTAVSNSTPLIHIARLGRTDLLRTCFDRVYIPGKVLEEVIEKGKQQGRKEVVVLDSLIQEGYIEVKNPSKLIPEIASLHRGEIEAISLCIEIKANRILVDDKEAVEAAKILGLKPLRTTALLLYSLKDGAINFNEFQDILLGLSEGGYFLDAKTYDEILKAARKMSEKK